MFTFNEEAMSWKSSKKTTTIDLMMDCEYITMSDVNKELI